MGIWIGMAARCLAGCSRHLNPFKPEPANPADLEDRETVARLLFYAQMINARGEIQSNAFPMDDILGEGGRSLSVDRCRLLGRNYHSLLEQKAGKFAKSGSNRAKHGYCLAVVGHIRAIRGGEGEQLFDVLPDSIEQSPPEPWDCAHAKLIAAKHGFSKSYLRGYRDKLCELFSKRIHRF